MLYFHLYRLTHTHTRTHPLFFNNFTQRFLTLWYTVCYNIIIVNFINFVYLQNYYIVLFNGFNYFISLGLTQEQIIYVLTQS